MCALDLARSGASIRGVVSVHGLLQLADITNGLIKAKVLALHGYDDPMVPPEHVLQFAQEMTDAGVDWQLHAYGLTQHAFTNPQANNPDLGTIYKESAAQRSWIAMKNFLEEIFR
jgi:dienelactone hydrolase